MAQLRKDVYDAAVRIAREEGIAPALLLTVIEVETGRGNPYETADTDASDGLAPTMLFEKHKFLDHLEERAPQKIAEARRLNLVEDDWQGPGSRQYAEQKTSAGKLAILKLAMSVDRECAIRATSLGLFQIMGDHAESLGYPSAWAFYSALEKGLIDTQIHAGVAFLRKNGLIPLMVARDWEGFARRYNGRSYAKNGYHTKLAAAFARYDTAFRSGEEVYSRPGDTMLRLGNEGARVRALQEELVRVGYPVKIDGDYGPSTRRAVTAFQLDHGLTVDGVAGPQTIEAIEKASPVAAGAREFATTRDLREEGSSIVRNSDNASKAVVGLAGSGGLLAAAPELMEQGQKIAEGGDVARSVVDSLGELVSTLMAHPSIILIGLGVLAVIYFTNKAKTARVEDRIEGRTV